MKNKFFVLFMFLVVSLSVSILAIVNYKINVHNSNDHLANMFIQLQNPIGVQKINVLNGDEFELILENQQKIHAILEVRTTPSAKPRVIELLNKITKPRIILNHQQNDTWVIQFYVTTPDLSGNLVEVSLSKWLTEKKLIYE